jgi:hypothetical protein
MKIIGVTSFRVILTCSYIYFQIVTPKVLTLSILPRGHAYVSNLSNARDDKKGVLQSVSSPTIQLEVSGSGSTQPSNHAITSDADPLSSDAITLHLVSLPPLSDYSPKIVKDVWKWKDIVLGDGRDYFVPRPRALKALSDIVVGSSYGGFVVKECAILSNCARMDVLLSVSADASKSILTTNCTAAESCSSSVGDSVKKIVSSCIINQLKSFQSQRSQRSTLVENLSSFLDLPGMVNEQATFQPCNNELESLLVHTSVERDIISHFCLVAAGLAPRASRPNREVVFRPFSSRDAHIMLQLKRTAEVASKYQRVKIVLDSALSAGKSARNPEKCPDLLKLQRFGGEGKYSQQAPITLSKEVANSVIEGVVEPMIEQTVKRIQALNSTHQIISLRKKANAILHSASNDVTSEQKKLLQEILHQPTLDMKEGKSVNEDLVLNQIRIALKTPKRENKLST